MLYTKFQGSMFPDSEEEDFQRFLPYVGMAAILAMWSGQFEQTCFPFSLEAVYEIYSKSAQWLQRRSPSKVWTTTENGRLHSIISLEAFGSGELKFCQGIKSPLNVLGDKERTLKVDLHGDSWIIDRSNNNTTHLSKGI